MRGDEADELALGLVGDHLEQAGEVLAFGGELDDLPAATCRTGTRPGLARRVSRLATSLEGRADGAPSLALAILKPRMVGRGLGVVEGGQAVLSLELGELGPGLPELGRRARAARVGDLAPGSSGSTP